MRIEWEQISYGNHAKILPKYKSEQEEVVDFAEEFQEAEKKRKEQKIEANNFSKLDLKYMINHFRFCV